MSCNQPVRIGLIGKYVQLQDAYLSVFGSLKHAGFYHGAKIELDWIQAEDVEGLLAQGRSDIDGLVIRVASGLVVEGKIERSVRSRKQHSRLGLCLAACDDS